jgi:hypothetical protein
MDKRSAYIVFICLLIISGCQKGIHWDLLSEGTLAKDSAGNCLPINAAGNFIINKPTNESNFLTVNVNVTAVGTYTITSDSVNGYSFNTSGVFNNVGYASVKLMCGGTPVTAGTDHFTIHYNNSFCEASVTVLSDTTPVANYTLQGSPGNCMDDTIQGSYIQGVLLDTSAKIIVSVNVGTPGTYSISTNTVNGYSFSASGVFTVSGIQSVTLSGNGTPANAGTDNFTVTAGSSTCSVSIPVAAIINVTNQDHFPLTIGSYWSYDDFNARGDTIERSINGDTMIDNHSYAKLFESKYFGSSTYYFVKNGDDYNEFGEVDKYTNAVQYGTAVYGMLPFLKENLATGFSWESDEFKGTASFGQVIYIKYTYKCLGNNATMSVNGFGFKDIYIIYVHPYIRAENYGYGPTSEAYYYYYAKGVGLVYFEEADNGGFKHPQMQIRNWHVN